MKTQVKQEGQHDDQAVTVHAAVAMFKKERVKPWRNQLWQMTGPSSSLLTHQVPTLPLSADGRLMGRPDAPLSTELDIEHALKCRA